MRTRTKPHSLFQEGDVAAVDPKLERLMQICGMQEMPQVHTHVIPLERITVPGEAQVRPSARFIRSVKLVGIRQPPSVAFCRGTAWDADDASYVVVMGRRRIVSARRLVAQGDARFQTIKCEVYERNVPRLNAFLGLMENDQRSEAWIQDVVSLRQLIREGVAMTLDDLAAYGFNRKTIKRRLDIALLPTALLDQICAGALSLDAAEQITRLKEKERERLAALVDEGVELTPELVKSLYRRQVDQGLASVHANLSQAWSSLTNESQALSSSPPVQPPATVPDGPPSVTHLLMLLHQFEPYTRTDAALQRAGTLMRVLIKELEMVQRHQPVPRQEGEAMHV